MKKITLKAINHLTKLAKLNPSDKKKKEYLKQLESIVSYVDELKEVDTKNVKETSQTTGLTNVKRDDVLRSDGLTQEQALSGSEKVHNGYFKVPGVIENRTE